ncbi:MAG TPA: DUF5808 domain-containing protein [Verrucomicrobiae bacterium]|nr:DUF5808 domain-containing protein [Verrucomicrobiae bacterium]
MNQRETNEREWADEDNWSGPKWLSLYFSKKDSRLWVPKQIRAMGWTINLGHRNGVFLFLTLLAGLLLSVILLNVLFSTFVLK